LELVALKAAIGQIGQDYAFSERRACGLMTMAVSSYRYQSRRSDEPLRTRLVELAREKPRFGYRRLHVLLGRAGEHVNHKRLHRVYREAGLMIRRKKRRHCVRVGQPLLVRTAANQEWGLDFLHDAVECGRAIRVLSVVDAYTRECLALEVDTSFASRRVTRVLDAIVAERGQPMANPLRQRAGTDQSAFSGVVRGATDRLDPHSARKAYAERTGGEFSRTAARRVFDGELVSELVRCAAQDRGVAQGVQRGAPAQQLGISDAAGVCCCDESD
jgi:transposase InsO family protein